MSEPPAAFQLLRAHPDQPGAVPGTTVYECLKDDYGCANQDSRRTGARHISVTLDPAGGYPFFTIAHGDLEPI